MYQCPPIPVIVLHIIQTIAVAFCVFLSDSNLQIWAMDTVLVFFVARVIYTFLIAGKEQFLKKFNAPELTQFVSAVRKRAPIAEIIIECWHSEVGTETQKLLHHNEIVKDILDKSKQSGRKLNAFGRSTPEAVAQKLSESEPRVFKCNFNHSEQISETVETNPDIKELRDERKGIKGKKEIKQDKNHKVASLIKTRYLKIEGFEDQTPPVYMPSTGRMIQLDIKQDIQFSLGSNLHIDEQLSLAFYQNVHNDANCTVWFRAHVPAMEESLCVVNHIPFYYSQNWMYISILFSLDAALFCMIRLGMPHCVLQVKKLITFDKEQNIKTSPLLIKKILPWTCALSVTPNYYLNSDQSSPPKEVKANLMPYITCLKQNNYKQLEKMDFKWRGIAFTGSNNEKVYVQFEKQKECLFSNTKTGVQ